MLDQQIVTAKKQLFLTSGSKEMLEAGTYLGPYKIARLIGSGGMGEVYRARDVRLERNVAIKILTPKLVRDPEALLRFQNEAKAVAALSHPNILAIHDFSHENDIYYTASELLEGETLRSRISRSALSWRKAAEIGIAVAQGLAAAHSKAIIHRDLKPENIFLTSNGQVKILDFGLAAIREQPKLVRECNSSRETEETAFGTIGYMSPEQVRGRTVDARSDIFSLGCILYEMLSGKRVFIRETVFESVAAVLKEDPPDLQSGKTIPLEITRIVHHCLEKNPDERMQSAHDLAFDLKAALASAESSKAILPKKKATKSIVLWVALVVLIALVGLGLDIFPGPRKSVRSIAVLPFGNSSHDRDMQYLSDGIPESIINNLSQLPRLRVMARSTVFGDKQRNMDPEELGRQLKVDSILLGSIEKYNNSLIVKVELVRVKDGSQLWGSIYPQAATRLIPIQHEIAKEITNKLGLELTGEEETRLFRHHTEYADAYHLYLRGRDYWNNRTQDGMKKAIGFFRQAIDIDPSYALAYSGLADAYSALGNYNFMSIKDAYPIAKTAAMKALEIDEQIGEAHASLGLIYVYYWQWEAAKKEYERAIELRPGYSTAHHWYANFLQCIGKPNEAIVEIEKAEELDPLSLMINSVHGLHLLLAHRVDEAETQIQKALMLDPNFVPAHQTLAEIYVEKRMYEKAMEEFETAIRLSGGDPDLMAELIHVYAVSGQKEKALGLLHQLRKDLTGKQQEVSSFELATVYTGLNMKEQAFQYLEKGYEEHSRSMPFLRLDPRLQSLRGDPRFGELLNKIGLAP